MKEDTRTLLLHWIDRNIFLCILLLCSLHFLVHFALADHPEINWKTKSCFAFFFCLQHIYAPLDSMGSLSFCLCISQESKRAAIFFCETIQRTLWREATKLNLTNFLAKLPAPGDALRQCDESCRSILVIWLTRWETPPKRTPSGNPFLPPVCGKVARQQLFQNMCGLWIFWSQPRLTKDSLSGDKKVCWQCNFRKPPLEKLSWTRRAPTLFCRAICSYVTVFPHMGKKSRKSPYVPTWQLLRSGVQAPGDHIRASQFHFVSA